MLVHGVGSEEQAIDPGLLKANRRFDDQRPGPFPVAATLEAGVIILEVEAVDQQPGAVQAAKPVADPALDMVVVEGGRAPARSADDAQLTQWKFPFYRHASNRRPAGGFNPEA